jgi:hypothetical protein
VVCKRQTCNGQRSVVVVGKRQTDEIPRRPESGFGFETSKAREWLRISLREANLKLKPYMRLDKTSLQAL